MNLPLPRLVQSIPGPVRGWILFSASLLACALHFLGLGNHRISLKREDIREQRGFGVRFPRNLVPGSPAHVNRHAHIEEDGWRRRSIRATSNRRVIEQGDGRFFRDQQRQPLGFVVG